MTFPVKPGCTMIGVAIGADIGNTGKGAATTAVNAFDKAMGWKTDFITDYKYPPQSVNKTNIRYQMFQGCTKPILWQQQTMASGWTVDDVLAGKHDAPFIADAKDMVTYGRANDWLAMGYEGEGNWFAGSAGVIGDANYAAVCMHMVDLYRANGFTGPTIWCYSVNPARVQGMNPYTAFPGTDVFDAVGYDTYERGGYSPWTIPATDHAKWWAYEGQPKMQAQKRFADEMGVPALATECGLFIGDHGGGDNGYWLTEMAQELQEGKWAGFAYYNSADGSQNSRLFDYVNGVFTPNKLFPIASKQFPGMFNPANFTGYPVQATDDQLAKAVGIITDLQGQLASEQEATAQAMQTIDVLESRIQTIKDTAFYQALEGL